MRHQNDKCNPKNNIQGRACELQVFALKYQQICMYDPVNKL